MKQYVLVGMAVAGLLALGGCVKESTYKAALAESQAAKEDLERTRAQKNALEQQVRTLKELNVKFGSEAQAAQDELQRIEHGRDKERGTIDVRTKELEDKVKQLTAQNRSVRQEYEDVKRHNETLKSLVARYQKELKERSRAATPSPSSLAPAPAALAPVPSMPSQPAPIAVPTPQQPAMAPVNVNRASTSDMVLFLGLTRDVAERIVNNRPYRIKGELVAKNVVPKETFDMIKDRISVMP